MKYILYYHRPVRHDLEGIWLVTLHVLHLKRISIADLVIRAAVVGRLNHDDIASWAAQFNGVTFARQLSPHQTKGHRRPAQS